MTVECDVCFYSLEVRFEEFLEHSKDQMLFFVCLKSLNSK